VSLLANRGWEFSCKIVDSRRLGEGTVEVDLSCGGEGSIWRSKEVWHVRSVGSRNSLRLCHADFRLADEIEGQENPPSSKMSVNINLECIALGREYHDAQDIDWSCGVCVGFSR